MKNLNGLFFVACTVYRGIYFVFWLHVAPTFIWLFKSSGILINHVHN